MHMPAPTATVGDRLRSLRQAVPVTMAELASAAGCSYGHLRMIEEGYRRPSPELATRLAQQLTRLAGRDITVAEFYEPRPRGTRTEPADDDPEPVADVA